MNGHILFESLIKNYLLKFDISGHGSLGLSIQSPVHRRSTHPSFCFFKVCITSPYIVLYIPYLQCKYKTYCIQKRSTGHCLNDIQRDGAFAATTVCFFLPVAFFFGRTTFIGSGAADELDEG